MKLVIIYSSLVVLFYFIDSQLDLPFLKSESIDPFCNIYDDPNKCIYCFDSNSTQITITFETFKTPQICLYYQYLKEPYACKGLLVATDEEHYPLGMTNDNFTNEMKDNNAFNLLNWETKKKCIGNDCKYYIETDQQVKAFAYSMFAENVPEQSIQVYEKNNQKYLEDSFVTFCCFVILSITIKLIPDEEQANDTLFNYIRKCQNELLLIIVLLAQPLRPLCFLNEFESIEWLIGQGFYTAGECYFLIIFLQILSYLRGNTLNSHFLRNLLVGVFVILPISFDRFIIAFDSHTRVIVNISDQIDYIDGLLKLCWLSFFIFIGLVFYELLHILQNSKDKIELIIIDIIFIVVYSLQKSHFYLYYEAYSHHLFNPINMLTMVSYVAIILTLNPNQNINNTSPRHKNDIEMEGMEGKHLQLDEEKEHQPINQQERNLEEEIADYYSDQKDVLI